MSLKLSIHEIMIYSQIWNTSCNCFVSSSGWWCITYLRWVRSKLWSCIQDTLQGSSQVIGKHQESSSPTAWWAWASMCGSDCNCTFIHFIFLKPNKNSSLEIESFNFLSIDSSERHLKISTMCSFVPRRLFVFV